MVATVSGSSHQYEHTVNTTSTPIATKEIKTHVQENRGTWRRTSPSITHDRRASRGTPRAPRRGGAPQERTRATEPLATGSAGGQGHAFSEVMAAEDGALAQSWQRRLTRARERSECSSSVTRRRRRRRTRRADCGQAVGALEALAPVEATARRRRMETGGDPASSARSSAAAAAADPAGSRSPIPRRRCPCPRQISPRPPRARRWLSLRITTPRRWTRDKLIEDQRATIRALVGALETRGGIREADVDGIPSGCTVAELESRHDALTRAAVGRAARRERRRDRRRPSAEDPSEVARGVRIRTRAIDRTPARRGGVAHPGYSRGGGGARRARARAGHGVPRGNPRTRRPKRERERERTAGERDGSARGMLDQLDTLDASSRRSDRGVLLLGRVVAQVEDEPSAKSKDRYRPQLEREAANRGNVAKGRRVQRWAAKHAQSHPEPRRREREGGRGSRVRTRRARSRRGPRRRRARRRASAESDPGMRDVAARRPGGRRGR